MAARRYPDPGDVVVEPFAGSAGYSLWHEPAMVVLVDADPVVCGVWDYLIRARAREILALPDLEESTEQVIDNLAIPQEARWLIGFWANRGSAQPAKRPSPWQVKYAGSVDNQLVWSQRARERIAADVHRVSHWSIINASYDDAPMVKDATYFVDPPYVKKGTRYKYKNVDHAELGRWCFRQSFTNPVIACEQEGAAWLPFAPLATVKSTRGTSAEVSWTGGPALADLWTGA